MKKIILFAFFLINLKSFSQKLDVIDTLIKSGNKDFLVSINQKLFSNREVNEYWAYSGEMVARNSRFIILIKQNTRKYGIIDLVNKVVVLPFEYDRIYNSVDSALVVKKNRLEGLFLPYENKLIETNNKKVRFLNNNRSYLLLRNDSLFLYNKTNQLLSTVDKINNFTVRLELNCIEIERDDLKGVIDLEGKKIIPIQFTGISILDNGNYILTKRDTTYIARKGDLKRLTLKNFYSFSKHKDVVIANDSINLIFYNQDGNLLAVVEGRLEALPINSDGDFFYKQNNLFGIISYKGKVIKKPFIKDMKIISGNNVYFEGKINNEWKMFDYKGNLTAGGGATRNNVEENTNAPRVNKKG